LQENRRPGPRFSVAGALLALSLPATAARAEAPPPPSFGGDVAPLLDRWCSSCHGPRHHHGGLRLDSYEAVLGGGDSGPAVIAGDAAGSLLVAKIERRDRPAMPPKRRLPQPAIAAIRAWIAAGAAR
jgi:mono/diheme cytochrome c family protein